MFRALEGFGTECLLLGVLNPWMPAVPTPARNLVGISKVFLQPGSNYLL